MPYSPLIARLEVVADLTERDKALIAGLYDDVRIVSAKRDIISEGERPEFIHLIVEGWAARCKAARRIAADRRLSHPGRFSRPPHDRPGPYGP